MLAYHAVEDGPPPLCIPPELFKRHLDTIVESGVPVLRGGEVAERGVCITFDDGAASVVRTAAPLLAERGLPATVFCVAGHLGGWNDWPSQRSDAYRFELASAEELAASGLEIGSHGFWHEPLRPEVASREVVDSRELLEQELQRPVTAFAYPYGVVAETDLVADTYETAYALGNTGVRPGGRVWAVARVDMHYLRRPELLRRAIDGRAGGYLAARRLAGRARRLVTSDYAR